jgi:hypothetical protein
MCVNILSCALLKQERLKHLKGIKIGRATQPLSYLLFAYDSFFFFKNDNRSTTAIQNTIAWYCSLSGQSINLNKYELFCSPNMTNHQTDALSQALGVKLVPQPSKYLGVTFKLRDRRVEGFQDLIDKVSARLQSWKSKLLSQAGRLTLINFVLTSLPIYTFSVFKILEVVCKKLDSLVNAFWWGHEPSRKKLHMTSWETITQPKNEVGLGIRRFGLMNKAMLSKQYWRICNNPNLLVSKTLRSKYYPNQDPYLHKPKQHASLIWKNIMTQSHPKLIQGSWRVGKGLTIPINHPAWFSPHPNAPQHLIGQISIVGDLIDQHNACWRTQLITQL